MLILAFSVVVDYRSQLVDAAAVQSRQQLMWISEFGTIELKTRDAVFVLQQGRVAGAFVD